MNTQDIKTTQHSQIVKKISFLNILISILLVIAGITTFYISSGVDKENSIWVIFLFLAAICLIAAGAILFFARWKYEVYEKTGSPVVQKTYSFTKKEIDILKSVLDQEQFQSGKPIVFLPNGDAHLDVLFSKDNQFAVAQLKEYIPFTFQPVSSIYYFHQATADAFIKYVNRYAQYV
ncbi:MAG: hypothetical protein LBU22_08140 [Dysgonamonadaceae bacterium]|jgi:hypothetical protein|nr:hypothetical protein [Dysgonamonadaceae bacterium]